jgi:hypothetical protein
VTAAAWWVWAPAVSVADPQGFRTLAEGALTVVAPNASTSDLTPRQDLHEITRGLAKLAWDPRQAARGTTLHALGHDREYPRDLWCLEFAFKPPRSIEVDVPTGGLQMRRKRVWYLVYRVRNTGGLRMRIDPDEPARREVERIERPVRFVPHFVLESWEPLADGEGMTRYRAYLDRLIPTALGPIARREDPRQRFFDSSSMAATDIPPGESRWGIATWEDIDPRIDFFSIYVRGLTNALQWRLSGDARVAEADPPGVHTEEVLQSLRLDFWRPGDARNDSGRQASIGFRGMFERMALGSRLLDDLGRPAINASRPATGLERLGLSWDEASLLGPDLGDDPFIPDWTSLRPLQAVLRAALKISDPTERTAALRDVVGDLGLVGVEELAAALAAPVDPVRDAERRAALATMGIVPEEAARGPLAALADALTALDALPPQARRAAASRLLGPAARRIDRLAREVESARAIAALEALGLPASRVLEGDALAAFERVNTAILGEPDEARRRTMLRALFGPRGPALQAAAAAFHEGIDHAWVFRYEQDEPAAGS